MGSRELIESLRAAGAEKVRALRAEAELEAERIRADARQRIGDVRSQRDREWAAEAAQRAAATIADASAGARMVRIRSERALADRLYALARAALPSLRNAGYEDVFNSFVSELPGLPWESVRVHPEDVPLAQARFPGVQVVSDRSISGGIVAVSQGGEMQVVNTFEKRFERIWEDVLPDTMQAALENMP